MLYNAWSGDGQHRVVLMNALLYLNAVLSWPEDGRLRPKHVAKYNLIVIIASCLSVCCVLTVQSIFYERWVAHGYTISSNLCTRGSVFVEA